MIDPDYCDQHKRYKQDMTEPEDTLSRQMRESAQNNPVNLLMAKQALMQAADAMDRLLAALHLALEALQAADESGALEHYADSGAKVKAAIRALKDKP